MTSLHSSRHRSGGARRDVRQLTIGIAIAAGLCALLLGAWKYSSARAHQLMGEIVNRVETDERVVALTFDDGPSARHAEDVLRLLEDRGVRATFFLVGEAVRRHPEAARQIVEAGHELGNHSDTHRRMVLVSPDFVTGEIERTDAALRAAGYDGPIHFRPPYGKKLVVLPWYLARTGRISITWDVEPETFVPREAPPDELVRHVLDRVRPGSIVLLHVMFDARESSREALPAIIDGLKQRGYRFVTVSELLALRGETPRNT